MGREATSHTSHTSHTLRISPWALIALLVLFAAPGAWAQKSEPDNVYLFPAGGQRGTQVTVSVEGENIPSGCDFHLHPTRGVSAPRQTRNHRISIDLSADAPLGIVPWRVATTNGGSGSRGFVIGEYPEVMEAERGPDVDAPQPVQPPVTVNGRINPQADVDRFSFELRAGEPFYAEVMAARLGGPIDTNVFVGQFGNPPGDVTYKQLDASLKVSGPDGSVVAQAEDTFGLDPAVGFRAPKTGRYVAEIHHLAYLGMPQFVYRLTLARGRLVEAAYPAGGRRGTSVSVSLVCPDRDENGSREAGQTVRFDPDARELSAALPGGASSRIPLRVGDEPEALETEPNDSPEKANPVALPATLNGRFLTPGDADNYRVTLRKGEVWRFEGWVERLGSPTDAVLSVMDASGKSLASDDDGVPGTHDPRLWFAAPADGEYLLQIREAGMSRLGERLVYRLEARPQPPEFEVEAGPEAAALSAGGSVEVNVSLRRLGGFSGPVEITAEGLPPGIACSPLVLAPNQEKGKLRLAAAPDAGPGSWTVRVAAKGTVDGREVKRGASVPITNPAETALGSAPRSTDDLLLTVRFPAPFKIEADESYVFMNLGTLYPAKVNLVREPGFTAPITLTMADRQPRDPQGITFDPMVVTDLKSEVFFPMRLPQGPRGNAIARVYVRAEAVVKDKDGREWHVLQTSPRQVVLRTQAPVFSLEAEPAVLRAGPGSQLSVRFRLGRTAAVAGPAEVRLIVPEGVRGVSMETVTVPAGQSEAEGLLRIGPDADFGPDTRFWLEATTRRGDNGYTVFFRVPVLVER